MSLVLAEEVWAARSSFSQSKTFRPRPAASLAMPAPFPEDLIQANPQNWLRHHCGRPTAPEDLFHPDAFADYLSCINDPLVVQGICEDYRAAYTIDIAHDDADQTKLQMPLLALWGANGAIAAHFDCLALWREHADFVAGKPLQGGHYLAEEVPEAVLAEWVPFFAALV